MLLASCCASFASWYVAIQSRYCGTVAVSIRLPIATTIINSISVQPAAMQSMLDIAAALANRPNELSQWWDNSSSTFARNAIMNAPLPLQSRPKARFVWEDPLLFSDQLADEERMVRDAAHTYAQEKLMPRV